MLIGALLSNIPEIIGYVAFGVVMFVAGNKFGRWRTNRQSGR